MQFYFSWGRILGVLIKETKEILHDPIAAFLIALIPLLQVFLFAYTLNSDPKHIPTIVVSADESNITREFINQMIVSDYFDIIPGEYSFAEAEELIKTGNAQFAIYFPPNFTRELLRGNQAQILVEADATDPTMISFAISIIDNIRNSFFSNIRGPLDYLNMQPNPIDIVFNPKYNPERISQYNILPGLLAIILTTTLVMLTLLGVVRERENGTMEVLLTTPLRPTEIILGKMIPYVLIAYIQGLAIILVIHYFFKVPMFGSVFLLLAVCFPFILANLVLGIAFSSFAENQMQAGQLVSFYFLPAILFSGFMYPFHALPQWGQFIGNLLPGTHFLVIVREIMLKGSGIAEIYSHILAIIAFFFVFLLFSIFRFRETLD